jgi:hypothetical protein
VAVTRNARRQQPAAVALVIVVAEQIDERLL